MFQQGYFKTSLVLLLIVLSGTHLEVMQRASLLAEVRAFQTRDEVLASLGVPLQRYDCAASTLPADIGPQSYCKGAAEIVTFKRCTLALLCPGQHVVIFSTELKAKSAYTVELPLLPQVP